VSLRIKEHVLMNSALMRSYIAMIA